MALQSIAGSGLWMPQMYLSNVAGLTSQSNISANASAAIAFLGKVWSKDHWASTKNIQSVEFRPGSITVGTSATVRLSIQGVSTAAGPSYRPDGTIKGTSNNGFVTFSTSTPTSNTWFAPGNLGAVVPVSYGDMIAVVWDWSAAGSGATFNVSGMAVASALHTPGCVTTTDGSTWTVQAVAPNVVLNFDDGTVGTIEGAYIASAINSVALNSGSTPIEAGYIFQVPFSCAIDGVWFQGAMAGASTTAQVELTDSTGSVLNSCSTTLDGHQQVSGGTRFWVLPLPETTLSINTDYYLGVRGTSASANNTTIYFMDVNSATHWNLMPGGQNFRYSTRNSGSSWAAATTTRRPFMGIRFSKLDDGTGGGGSAGMLYLPGLDGIT